MVEMLLSVFLLLCFAPFGATGQCIKQPDLTCGCRTSSGTVVDLNALPSTLSARDPKTNNLYYVSPCKALTQPQGCVQLGVGVISVCQAVPPDYYDAGDVGSQVFAGDPAANSLTVTYSGNKPPATTTTRTSIFKLTCADGVDLKFEAESPTNTYLFTLATPIVCPSTSESGGLSTGSILVIIFFVFFIAYWIGGFIFMKFVRRAEGLEAIPNYEFWKELPLLIRDGVAFTVRGCKGESTYQKI